MIKNISVNLLIFIVAGLVCFVAAEIVVRSRGRFDEDGRFHFRGRIIPPYVIPVDSIEQILDEYLSHVNTAGLVYDEYLGWAPRPSYNNGKYVHNSVGIRSDREYELGLSSDTLRIALFGDSYTYDPDVEIFDTWGQVLERTLNEKGIRTEVINFGVSAYGMDQAYLRWKTFGGHYQPDIVIFGYALLDTQRNVNLFRQILSPRTQIPLSKPRFILSYNELQLINYPTLPIDDIVPTLENFHQSPLREYEYYYDGRFTNYEWWMESKFLSVIKDTLSSTQDNQAKLGSSNEIIEMAQAITKKFSDDVTASGSQFVVAFLPDKLTKYQLEGLSPKYDYLKALELLPQLAEDYLYIDTENAFEETEGIIFTPEIGHYSAEQNLLIGAYVADKIIECIQTEQCKLNRLDVDVLDM